MNHFAHPERLLWLIPWALFMISVLRHQRRHRQRLTQLMEEPSLQRLAQEGRPGRRTAAFLMQTLALAWWLVAWAGPQWGSQIVKIERDAIDIVFLFDCSKSMAAADPAPSRHEVAVRELSQLMEKFQGNRMALVGFAGKAFIFCPPTMDSSATELFLEQLDDTSMPVPGTSLGEAVRVGLTLFPADPKTSKVMILLTDGEDHRSHPLDAAQEAAKAGVTLYTVGVGSPEGAPIPQSSMPNDYIKDAKGKVVISKLDEPLLRQMAQYCGGTFLRIQNATDNLDTIVTSVLSKERQKLDSQRMVKKNPQFSLFVALGMAFLFLGLILIPRVPTEEAGR